MPKDLLETVSPFLLAKGDLKMFVLLMLRERPIHGYEIMQAFEERHHGFYKPSAGSVYPALRSLLRKGLVTVSGNEHKKTYRITPRGRRLLRSREAEIQRRFEEFAKSVGPERAALVRELRTTGRLLKANLRNVTPAQADELRKLIVDTRKKMMAIVAQ